MNKKIIHTALYCLFAFSAFSQTQWPLVTQTSRPWTRWWWMGSGVDTKNISSLLKTYSLAGIGGVEIVPIYGAKGFEHRYTSYLSPQWMGLLDTTVAVATKLNMGVDASVGTGWPIGGPQVTLNDAATKLVIQQYKLTADQNLSEKIRINDPKQKYAAAIKPAALMAYSNDGKILDITDKVSADGSLSWIPEKGEWDLYAAFNAKTFQKVKRAAPGGEGYTFDHFSASALGNYFKKFDTAYGNTSHGVRSFFNDSYEVFNANWSPDFFSEFKKRRGYDLRKYLREFNSNDSTALVAAIKSDYRETMADLMLDNFSDKFTSWAHSKKALSTNQAHGSPGNLLDMYAAVDIAETETFGSAYFPIPGLRRDSADIRDVDPDPIMSKFASSAAHVTGHKLVSSETFTWLTEHFKTSWAQCKPEVDNLFLSGVNHVFFHGTTYSPSDAAWPGWLFYASVNFVPANSLWPQLKGLSDYITRCQSVLQAGQPDNEILVYWPVYDIWNNPKGTDKPLKMHNIDDWLQPSAFYKLVKQLQQKGYATDAVSDKMIADLVFKNGYMHVGARGATYKTIIVPACKTMPLSTLQKLKALSESGATVIFQALPLAPEGLDVSGDKKNNFDRVIASFSFSKDKVDTKASMIGKGMAILSPDVESPLSDMNIFPEPMTAAGLQYICRAAGNDKFYFVVNQTASLIDTTIAINARAKIVVLMDPVTGEEGQVPVLVRDNKNNVRLQIPSGGSIILKTLQKKSTVATWKYSESKNAGVRLDKNWKVKFIAGGPALPASRDIESLGSWTEWGDTTLQNFSGTALYSTSFLFKRSGADDYVLKLGKVCESARVWVNGKDAGIVWSLPFEIRIGKYLKDGNNEIKIEVVNLMANRIRYMDRNKIPWRNYHEINFVNINYKEFDASGWALQPSGLLGPVMIQPVQFSK
jgi:hypothetical protein